MPYLLVLGLRRSGWKEEHSPETKLFSFPGNKLPLPINSNVYLAVENSHLSLRKYWLNFEHVAWYRHNLPRSAKFDYSSETRLFSVLIWVPYLEVGRPQPIHGSWHFCLPMPAKMSSSSCRGCKMINKNRKKQRLFGTVWWPLRRWNLVLLMSNFHVHPLALCSKSGTRRVRQESIQATSGHLNCLRKDGIAH